MKLQSGKMKREYRLKPTAVDNGTIVVGSTNRTVSLPPKSAMSMDQIRTLYERKELQKVAKYLGVGAVGKTVDMFDRIVAEWKKRGDLVSIEGEGDIPIPPRRRMSVMQWVVFYREHMMEVDSDGSAVRLEFPEGDNPVAKRLRNGRDSLMKKWANQELTVEEIDALKEVGFPFSDKWDDYLSMFQEFKDEHGHLNVTERNSYLWPGLYTIVQNLRRVWKKQQLGRAQARGSQLMLTEERKSQLLALGFKFNPTGWSPDDNGGRSVEGGGAGTGTGDSDDAAGEDDTDGPDVFSSPPSSNRDGTNESLTTPTSTDDRVTIMATKLSDPFFYQWFDLDPEGAMRDLFCCSQSDEAPLAKSVGAILRCPGFKALVGHNALSAAELLVDGCLSDDTGIVEITTAAVFSREGFRDFASSDPVSTARIILGRRQLPPSLVEKLSNFLQTGGLQKLLSRDSEKGSSLIDKFIAREAGAVASKLAAPADSGAANGATAADASVGKKRDVAIDVDAESKLAAPADFGAANGAAAAGVGKEITPARHPRDPSTGVYAPQKRPIIIDIDKEFVANLAVSTKHLSHAVQGISTTAKKTDAAVRVVNDGIDKLRQVQEIHQDQINNNASRIEAERRRTDRLEAEMTDVKEKLTFHGIT